MGTGTDERRLTAMMTRLFPRLGRPNRLRASGRRIPLRRARTPAQVPVLPAPIPEVAPASALEETTAVAAYDAVTRKVAVADIVGAALPPGAVPVPIDELEATVPVPTAPPRAEEANASSRDEATASTRAVPRRRRAALAALVLAALLLAWGVAVYEVWFLFVR